MEKKLGIVLAPTSVGAAIRNEDSAVPVIEGTEHGVVDAARRDKTATDNCRDAFGLQKLMQIGAVEAVPVPLHDDRLTLNLLGKVLCVSVMYLIRKVGVQLADLCQEW